MFAQETISYLALGYFLGSIPFGLLLTRFFLKKDIRKIGSGNIGATNVLRTGNKRLAALTLLLDALKATLAVAIVYAFTSLYQIASIPAILAALGAILGHCFPIWLKFKGGKGVATALGGLLAAVPYAGLAACAVWLITAKLTKISSLSALIALTIAPMMTFFIYGTTAAVICTLISLLVFWRHKENIKRLLNGTEPKIGTKKKEEANAETVSE